MRKLLVVDPLKCTGCRACEAACSIVKESESNIYKSRIRTIRFPDQLFFYPHVCSQCETPHCAAPCPTAAIKKDPDTGVVEVIKERCVGCRLCLLACPFGAMGMVDGLASKCDLCGGDPACVRLCEPKAIAFGDSEGFSAPKRILLAGKIRDIYLAKEEKA
ncbi:MAG: 4Fe-4S dicluster domain-containing protein [Chloroflexota bacterium]|nr:4Fe-4S dicluster domain-containing protein [Chloroflexota bacterium]